ncbi:Uncharacterized conserved membrane protein, UPF0127 family [Acinetobacter marinus]|uniref:Uncharacterized conserved membrane protein, UPF0127 family n=1 Tax=Acinetobacter marinus TaxID=281375 RepID=A0A1G6HKQ7_9GAMM|nr:DUF192 domain-containing protein [Acinetobacter marinus]SDB94036.1 Uncharacterized conserved membrane protein, UPF0127 family [Acinetobacter marinus]
MTFLKSSVGLFWLTTLFVSNLAYANGDHNALICVGDVASQGKSHRTPPAKFYAELATTPDQQRQGLMFRQSMADDQAMLFIYPEPHQVGFWMRNTLIPLDMLFFDDRGELREIKQNIPPCKTQNCPIYVAKSSNIKYVLEINAGQSQLWDIQVGDQLYGCGK